MGGCDVARSTNRIECRPVRSSRSSEQLSTRARKRNDARILCAAHEASLHRCPRSVPSHRLPRCVPRTDVRAKRGRISL